jgi:ribosome biogenesis SPOUT family RNA methylase Rps3
VCVWFLGAFYSQSGNFLDWVVAYCSNHPVALNDKDNNLIAAVVCHYRGFWGLHSPYMRTRTLDLARLEDLSVEWIPTDQTLVCFASRQRVTVLHGVTFEEKKHMNNSRFINQR